MLYRNLISCLLFLIFLSSTFSLQGQRGNKPTYSQIKIVTGDASKASAVINQPGLFDTPFKSANRGFFHHTDSTGLYYATSKVNLRAASTLLYVPAASIEVFQLRHRHNKGKKILKGIAIGAFSGALFGLITGKSKQRCTSEPQLFVCGKKYGIAGYGTLGLVLGTGIGLLTATTRRHYYIHGKKDKLRAQTASIKQFVY